MYPTTTKAKIRYKTDEGEVNKKGGKKLRTRSLGNIDPGIGEEKAKRTMLALGMLIVFPIVSVELIVEKTHHILAPQTRKEELEEKEQESLVAKEVEEVQAIQSTSAQIETVQSAPAIIGEPVKLLDMGMESLQRINPKLFYKPTPAETTAEVGYVAPLSYMDIPGYAEQISGVGF